MPKSVYKSVLYFSSIFDSRNTKWRGMELEWELHTTKHRTKRGISSFGSKMYVDLILKTEYEFTEFFLG